MTNLGAFHLPLGQHLISEFHGARNLLDPAPVATVLEAAAKAAGASVLDIRLHDFGARFGFTGVALLAESHISLHTWPEHNFAAIDIFMCGDANPQASLNVLAHFFEPDRQETQILPRGRIERRHVAPAAL